MRQDITGRAPRAATSLKSACYHGCVFRELPAIRRRFLRRDRGSAAPLERPAGLITTMRRFYPSIAIALCALLMSPMGFAQSAPPPAGSSGAGHTSSLSDQPQVPLPPGDFLTRGFRPPAIAPINMGNSNRLESLIRAGKLYLSDRK